MLCKPPTWVWRYNAKDHITKTHPNDTGSTEADGSKSQWRITNSTMEKLTVVEADEQEAVLKAEKYRGVVVKKRKSGAEPSNKKKKPKKK